MCTQSGAVTVFDLLEDSFLTDMNCSTLTDPANGQVSHTAGTTFRQTATYSCDTGYNLVGDSTRICHDTGVWSGSAPTCQGMLFLGFRYVSSENASYVQNVMIMFSDWIPIAFSSLAI